jgi:hypothetical protein
MARAGVQTRSGASAATTEGQARDRWERRPAYGALERRIRIAAIPAQALPTRADKPQKMYLKSTDAVHIWYIIAPNPMISTWFCAGPNGGSVGKTSLRFGSSAAGRGLHDDAGANSPVGWAAARLVGCSAISCSFVPDAIRYRYAGSLHFWPSWNSLGTRSFPQILPPARLGFAEKCSFLSRK